MEKIGLLKRKERSVLRLISMMLLAAFVCQELAYANPELKPIDLKIDLFSDKKWAREFLPDVPESVAVIESANKSHQVTRSPGHKIVVLLQDAHTNYSAQKNEAVFLDKLLAKHPDISHIYTEAAWGDVSLSELRERAPLTLRDQVSKKYLRQGLLHGVEYLDVTSEHRFKVWGVEDAEQYKRSVQTYTSIAKKRSDFDAYISKFEAGLYWLAPRVLNPLLQKFEARRQKFRKDEISLTEYFDALTQQASAHTISLAAYKNLNSLKRIQMLERGIDFAKANAEMVQAIVALSDSDKKELFVKSRQPSVSQIGAHPDDVSAGFFACLHEMIQTGAYPQLDKYFSYRDQIRELDMKQVLTEMTHFEEKVLEKLQTSDDERSWVRARRYAETHHALFALTLTPADHQQYKTVTSQNTIEALTGFLNEKLLQYGGEPDGVVFLKSGYKDMVKACEAFYELTLERDEMFVSNMLRKMDAEKQDKAVLITGGYHTNNIRRLLTQKNISTISVTPQVLHETNIPRYEKILLSQDLTQITSGSGYAAKMNMTLYAKMPGASLGLRQFMDEMHPTGARLAGSSRVVRTKEQFRADWVELKKSLDNAAAPLTANQLAVLTKIPLSKIYQSLSFVPENDKPLNQHDKYNSPENIKRQNTARERALIKASMDAGDDSWKAIQAKTGLPAKKIYEHVLRDLSLKSHVNSPIESKRVFTKEQVAEIKSRIAQFLDFGRFSSSEIAGLIGISVSAATDFIRNSSALAGHQNLLKQDRKKPDLSKEVRDAKKLMALLLTSGNDDDISLILEGLRGKSLGKTGRRGIILPIKPMFYKYWDVQPGGEVGWDVNILSAKKVKSTPYVRLSISTFKNGRTENDFFLVDLSSVSYVSGQSQHQGERILVRDIMRWGQRLGRAGHTKVNLDAVDKMGIPQSQGHGAAQNPALIHDRKKFWDAVVSVLERKGSRKYSDLVADLSQGADLDGALMSIPEEERIEVRQALQEALRPYISGARLARRTSEQKSRDQALEKEILDSGRHTARGIADKTGIKIKAVYHDLKETGLDQHPNYVVKKTFRATEQIEAIARKIAEAVGNIPYANKEIAAITGLDFEVVENTMRSSIGRKSIQALSGPRRQGAGKGRLSRYLAQAPNVNWSTVWESLPRLEGYLGKTDSEGSIILWPHSGSYFRWRLLGFESAGWSVTIVNSGLRNGNPYFKVNAEKEGKVLRKTFQISRASKIIRSARSTKSPVHLPILTIAPYHEVKNPAKRRRFFKLIREQDEDAFVRKAAVLKNMHGFVFGTSYPRGNINLLNGRESYDIWPLNGLPGDKQSWTMIWDKHRLVGNILEADVFLVKPDVPIVSRTLQISSKIRQDYAMVRTGRSISFASMETELAKTVLERMIASKEAFERMAPQWVGEEELDLGALSQVGSKTLVPVEGYYTRAYLGGFVTGEGWSSRWADRKFQDGIFTFRVVSRHPTQGEVAKYFYIDPEVTTTAYIQSIEERFRKTEKLRILKISPLLNTEDIKRFLSALPTRADQWTKGRNGNQRTTVAVSKEKSPFDLSLSRQIWQSVQELADKHPNAKVRKAAAYFSEQGEIDGFLQEQPQNVQTEVRSAFAEALRPFASGARLARSNADEVAYRIDALKRLAQEGITSAAILSEKTGISYSLVRYYFRTAEALMKLAPAKKPIKRRDSSEREEEYNQVLKFLDAGESSPKRISELTGIAYENVRAYFHHLTGRLKDHPSYQRSATEKKAIAFSRASLAKLISDPVGHDGKLDESLLASLIGSSLGKTDPMGRIRFLLADASEYSWSPLGRQEEGWEVSVKEAGLEGGLAFIKVNLVKGSRDKSRKFYLGTDSLIPSSAVRHRKSLLGKLMRLEKSSGLQNLVERLSKEEGGFIGIVGVSGKMLIPLGTPQNKYTLYMNTPSGWEVYLSHVELKDRLVKIVFDMKKRGEHGRSQVFYVSPYSRTRWGMRDGSSAYLNFFDKEIGRRIIADVIRPSALKAFHHRARLWEGASEVFLGVSNLAGGLEVTPWDYFGFNVSLLGFRESGVKMYMYDRKVENDMFVFSVRYEHPTLEIADRTFAIPFSPNRRVIRTYAKHIPAGPRSERTVLRILDLDVLGAIERKRAMPKAGSLYVRSEDKPRVEAVDTAPSAYDRTQATLMWDILEKLGRSHPSPKVREAVEYFFQEQEIDGFIADQPAEVRSEVKAAFAEVLRPFAQGARLAQDPGIEDFPVYIQKALRVLQTATEIAPSQREGFSVSPVAEQLKEIASKIKDLAPSGNLLGHFNSISYQDTPEFYKLIVVVSSLFQHYRKQFLSFNQVGRIETRMRMASEVVRKEMGLRGERANRLLELYLSHEFSIELEIEKGRGAELTDDQQKALISTLVKQKILSSKSRVDLDQMRQMTSGQAVRLMDELKSLEKIVSERFYKGEEQVRWFRFMSLEMEAMRFFDSDNHMLSAKTVNAYKGLYQELLWRGYDPRNSEADYIFPGGDISAALLLTNARVIRVHDVLPYDDPSVTPPTEDMRMIYTAQKASAGYNSSDLLKAIGALKYPIRWELEALGATQITEKPLKQKGAYEIYFLWSYDKRSAPIPRKVVFTQGDEEAAPRDEDQGDQVSIVKANLFRGNTFSPRSKFVITFEKSVTPDGYDAVPIVGIVQDVFLKGRLHYDHPSGYADLSIGSLFIRKDEKRGARLAQNTATDLKIIVAAQVLSEADPLKRISTKEIAVKAGVGVSTVSLRMTKNEDVKKAVNLAMSVDRRIIKAAELFVSSGEKKITAQKIADRIDVNINTITTRKNADPDVRKAVEDATSFDNQIFRSLDRIRASHKGAVTKGLIADESGLFIQTINGRMRVNEKIKEAIDEMMRLTEADLKILDAIERLKSRGVRAVTQEMIADEADVNEATVSDSKQRDERMRTAIESAASLNEKDVKMLDATEAMKINGEKITPRRLAAKAAVDHKTVRRRLRSDTEVGNAILTARAEVQAQLNILKHKHDLFIDQVITRVIRELASEGMAVHTVSIAERSGLSLRLVRNRVTQNKDLRKFIIDKNMSTVARNIPIVSKSARQWDKAENDRKLQAVSRERTPDQAAIATEMWGILSRKLSGMGDKYEVIAQRLMGGDDLDGFLSEGVISEKEMLDLKQILREALSGYANTRPDGARLAATLTATRRTGAVMIGSTKFHIKMRDGKVVIYQRNGFGWSKAFIAASGSIRSISQSSQIHLEMSQADLMALLKTFSMKVDTLDAAQTELKNKNALAVLYVDRFVNEKTWDESLRVLSAQMAKLHRSDPKARIMLAGVRSQKVYQELIQINPSLADFIYANDESVPTVFKNAPRTILEALDSSSVPTHSEGRRLFVQALPDGAVYNFYDLIRMALIEARMGELSTSNPVVVDFMRTWSDLLGEPIKSIDQFMRVLSGEERNIQVILQFAFIPKPLPIQLQARAYMMMSRQFAQAA